MKLFSKQSKDIIVQRTQFSDLEDLSSIHKLCFSRAWSLDDFIGFYQRGSMLFWTAQQVGGSICGFNIVRFTPPEAEIISIGVHPNFHRLGIGEKLMRSSINHLLSEGVKSLFLEVAEQNISAVSLYKHLGFSIISERKGYYSSDSSDSSTALVMRLQLV